VLYFKKGKAFFLIDLKLAPSSKQLEKLKEHAMDAFLIVSIEGEEIARFDLSNSD